jgi:hypothetical protein
MIASLGTESGTTARIEEAGWGCSRENQQPLRCSPGRHRRAIGAHYEHESKSVCACADFHQLLIKQLMDMGEHEREIPEMHRVVSRKELARPQRIVDVRLAP